MPSNMTPQEIQDIVDKYNQAMKDGTPITDELNQSMQDAVAGIQSYTKQIKASKDAFVGSLKNLGMAYVNGEHGAAMYNDVVKSGAKTFSVWNKGGKDGSNIMGKTAEAMAWAENVIAKQADALFKGYQDLSKSGLALGMQQAGDNLEKAGFTMKEIGDYTAVMQENAQQLAILGGTAATGADKFANISKEIVKSDMSNQLMNMGQSIPEINRGIGRYVKFQQMSGATMDRDEKSIAQNAARFIAQQDILTKLTGASADEQMKIFQTAQGEQQWAGKRNHLLSEIAKYGQDSLEGKKASAQLEKLDTLNAMNEKLYGPKLASDMRMAMAGAVNTPGYRRASLSAGNFAKAANDQAVTSGEAFDILNRDLKKTTTDMGWMTQFGVYNDKLVDFQESIQSQNLANINHANAQKDATAQQNKQRVGADQQTKNMTGVLQKQRDLTQKSDQTMMKGMPLVTSKLADLAGVADDLGSSLKDVVDKITGSEADTGHIGGASPGLWEHTKSFFGFGKGTAPAATPAPAPSGPPSGPSGGGSQNNTNDVNSFINFGGNTGDKTHFDELNSTVRSSFVAMANDYYSTTGKKLQVNSAFRTPEEQASLNSGSNPKAAPGKSLHNLGKALDISPAQRSELASNGMLERYGFSLPPFQDPPHIQMPSAATGGVLSGPTSGYTAMLHGNEAVVPLPDGKTIPIQHKGGSSGSSQEQVKLLSQELSKLDILLNVMQKQNDITNKILQRQS